MPEDYRSAYGRGYYGEGYYGYSYASDIGVQPPRTPAAANARTWRPYGDMDGGDVGPAPIPVRGQPQGTAAMMRQLGRIRVVKPPNRKPVRVLLAQLAA